MRILCVSPLWPPHSLVGAWLSTAECMRAMVERGHEVTVVQIATRMPAYMHEGVEVHGRGVDLAGLVNAADVVVSHLGDNQVASKLAQKTGKPNVRMVHSHHADAHRRLQGATLAVFNSEHVRTAAKWRGPTMVVHPPVPPERYATTPGTAVTLVNLADAKGGPLLWKLARAMPDVEFLGVKGALGKQVGGVATNVEVLETTADMRGVYGRTRILLMPSRSESWGRVGVEAMCSGIPTIAAPTPGLQESLGDAGIFVEREDQAGWVRQIRELLEPSEWARASERSLARSQQLHPAADLERFANSIEGLARKVRAA